MKRRTYQQRQRAEGADETRRRIVRATFELHGEQGIAATTMKQIAQRADVSIGTVYHHFPTLDQTVQACGEMVMMMYPPPTEAVLDGAKTLHDRAFRIAHALFFHLDQIGFDLVRPDQHQSAVVKHHVDLEEARRIELTQAALAPFKVDRDLIRVIAALLDIEVYRGLQRAGLSLDQAATAIAEIVHARVTRKD